VKWTKKRILTPRITEKKLCDLSANSLRPLREPALNAFHAPKGMALPRDAKPPRKNIY